MLGCSFFSTELEWPFHAANRPTSQTCVTFSLFFNFVLCCLNLRTREYVSSQKCCIAGFWISRQKSVNATVNTSLGGCTMKMKKIDRVVLHGGLWLPATIFAKLVLENNAGGASGRSWMNSKRTRSFKLSQWSKNDKYSTLLMCVWETNFTNTAENCSVCCAEGWKRRSYMPSAWSVVRFMCARVEALVFTDSGFLGSSFKRLVVFLGFVVVFDVFGLDFLHLVLLASVFIITTKTIIGRVST